MFYKLRTDAKIIAKRKDGSPQPRFNAVVGVQNINRVNEQPCFCLFFCLTFRSTIFQSFWDEPPLPGFLPVLLGA